jgi:hypothetical protein
MRGALPYLIKPPTRIFATELQYALFSINRERSSLGGIRYVRTTTDQFGSEQ